MMFGFKLTEKFGFKISQNGVVEAISEGGQAARYVTHGFAAGVPARHPSLN